jgi:hypothetical protein
MFEPAKQSPLREVLGLFYNGVPVMLAVTCAATVLYLTLRKRHLGLAAFFVGWFCTVMYAGTELKFVSGLHWDIPQDLAMVAVSNVLFAIPILVFYLTYTRRPSFKKFMLEDIPAADMIAFHVCRIAGAAYIYLHLTEGVRNLVVLQVGVFDLFISLTALPLASYVRSVGLEKASGLVKLWNVIGILDLVIPFTLFPLNLFDLYYTPVDSLSFFMMWPIIGIFLYNVPIAMVAHVLQLSNIEGLIATEKAKKSKNK